MEFKNMGILRNKKALLCVSGGVDSMVLLDIIVSLSKPLCIDIAVCHFEHGIRGKASKEDMDFVVSTCNSLSIPVFTKCEDIPAMARGKGIEELARKRRYAFFYETLKNQNCDYLVLAHHKDDNCETVLMNIIRGCGTAGLCGMEEISGVIFRPLLCYTKNEIINYAKNMSISFRNDSTNFDCNYFRNSIRNELIPMLKEKNPSFVDAVDKMRDIISEENSFLDEYVESLNWINKSHYGYDIKVDQFHKAHNAIKRRCVYYVLKQMQGKNFDFKDVENIIGLLDKSTGKKAELDDLEVYRQGEVLSFVKRQAAILNEIKLNIPGRTDTKFGSFIVEKVFDIPIEQIKNAPFCVGYFTLDKATNLMVRNRQEGDRITCFSGHEKKLKDILIDGKVPVFLRDKIPIICDEETIVFVPGIIRSNKHIFLDEGIRITFIDNTD